MPYRLLLVPYRIRSAPGSGRIDIYLGWSHPIHGAASGVLKMFLRLALGSLPTGPGLLGAGPFNWLFCSGPRGQKKRVLGRLHKSPRSSRYATERLLVSRRTCKREGSARWRCKGTLIWGFCAACQTNIFWPLSVAPPPWRCRLL